MRTLRFYGYLWGFLVSCILKLPLLKRYQKQGDRTAQLALVDTMAGNLMDRLVRISGASVTVTGREHVPTDEAILFVGNHQSNLDIPLLFSTSPVKMSFVAKKELGSIPLIGFWMKEGACTFLDRDNPRASLKTINETAQLLSSGRSMAIFPEGTRSKSPKMGDFKAGSMKIATKANIKIIPVSIRDSYRLLEEHGRITPAPVSVHYGAPIDASQFKDTKELATLVERRIQEHL